MNIHLEDSATVTINSLAQQKINSGMEIYNFSVGEPKLPIHPLLHTAAIEAMEENKAFYPPISGIPELRYSATKWMNDLYGCSYHPKNCLVVNGGKLGIYLLLQLLLKKDDEVIIASPYWVSYPTITQLFGGVPVIVETHEHENWKLTPDKIKNACTNKSKILIINNGANPTGTLYSKQELEEILKIAKQYNLLVLSDEVYSGLTYDNNDYISCGSFDAYQDNVIVIQSCSKNFSMTGWRVGFVFGNENIIKQLTTLLSQSTSGVTTISQWVAISALRNEKIINSSVNQEMQKRRDIMVQELNKHLQISLKAPPSSLYIFISLKDLRIKNISSSEFCKQVLQDANIALVPGSAFGKEGYIRLSFSGDTQDLIMGVKALSDYLKM